VGVAPGPLRSPLPQAQNEPAGPRRLSSATRPMARIIMSRAAAWPGPEAPFSPQVLGLACPSAAIQRRVDELGRLPRPDVLCGPLRRDAGWDSYMVTTPTARDRGVGPAMPRAGGEAQPRGGARFVADRARRYGRATSDPPNLWGEVE
jgi:hypothetical protein